MMEYAKKKLSIWWSVQRYELIMVKCVIPSLQRHHQNFCLGHPEPKISLIISFIYWQKKNLATTSIWFNYYSLLF
jgi:hypothetical protein